MYNRIRHCYFKTEDKIDIRENQPLKKVAGLEVLGTAFIGETFQSRM